MSTPPDCGAMTRRMLMQANARMDMPGMRVLFPATEEINTRITQLFSDRIPSLEDPTEPALVQAFRCGRGVFHASLGEWRNRQCTLPDVFRVYFEAVLSEITLCAQGFTLYIASPAVVWDLQRHGPLTNHYSALQIVANPTVSGPSSSRTLALYADWVLTHADRTALRYSEPHHG